MSKINSPVRGRKIVGVFLAKKDTEQKSDDEVSETEEEDNEPEFLDMNEINSLSSGGQVMSVSWPRRTQVVLKELRSGREWDVEGHFPFTDPWWEVGCSVPRRGKLVLQGGPAYRLLSCPSPGDARSMTSLFLRGCGVAPEQVMELLRWLPGERAVTPRDLVETLSEFEEGEDEDQATMAEQIRKHVLNSDAGIRVQVATAYPQVMLYLPTLFPRQFLGLVQKGLQEGGKTLTALEGIIKTDVWKLGFKSVLKREAGLLRCEAAVEAFQVCGLWQRIPPLQQSALQVYRQLKKEHLRTGSTYMEMQDLLTREVAYEPEIWEAVHFLRGQGVVVVEKRFVGLQDYHSYETGIAQSLRGLVDGEAWSMELDVREVLRAGTASRARAGDGTGAPHLDPDQVRAAEMICANAVTVVSGKGGCGKTTVVSLVLGAALEQQRSPEDREVSDACRDFQNDTGGSQSWDIPLPSQSPPTLGGQPKEGSPPSEKKIEVLLTAPTGRAAAILTKRTKFTAYTLHQVIWSFMNWRKDKSGAQEEWKFAAVRALVVDEGSMVSVQLLHSVLHMLMEHACLQKFVLLGDVRQLPSIEPGNTLHDLFYSLTRVGWATEMRTNHRAESQLIVRNAGLISEQRSSLEFDAVLRMDASPAAPPPEKSFIHVVLPEDQTDSYLRSAILLLLTSDPGLKDDKTSQFITFRRKDCELINKLCCEHYSGHNTGDKGGLSFQQRDKVCCSKNGYVCDRAKEQELQRAYQNGGEEEGDEKKTEVKERLCNGQIFFITGDVTEVSGGRKGDQKRYLTLDDREGRVVTVWFRELQRECKLQHGWAKTIHTFQGSEAETVVYVLGKSSHIQCWKHVYTAVTRGRRRVFVVSTEAGLRATVVNKDKKRNTRLGELVRREFPLAKVEGEKPNGTQPHAPQRETQAATQAPKPAPTPGPGPPMSTSLAPDPSSQIQRACTSGRPMMTGGFRKAGAEQDASTSRTEDLAFGSTNMDWADTSCTEGAYGKAVEEAGGSAGCQGAESTPGPTPSTPSSRRTGSPTSPCGGTPSKQPRLGPEESPLSSTGLQRLSLDGCRNIRKQIFPANPPEP